MSSSRSPSETTLSAAAVQRLRACMADLDGDGTRLDTGVAVVLLVMWSYLLFRHFPLQFFAEEPLVRLDTTEFLAGSLIEFAIGLAGTVSAWGFLHWRVWGYLGSVVLSGLWLAPFALGSRVLLFVVFWYLLWINHRFVGGGPDGSDSFR